MLIKKITLKNFQAHKALTLDLAEFTAITGPSSAGKSAVLRALAWLFYGDWDKTYPNDPELDTAVAIQLENGTIWGRFRKGNRNWAMCRRPGEKPLTYQDFGELVPGLLEEINVRPIKIGTSKVNLNFSMQDDPIFMVHESKPAKAQWIGRLYGAHIVNMMLRLMAKDKRAIESDKKTAEDEETRLRSELSAYEGLEEKAQELSSIGNLINLLDSLKDCQDMLSDIMRSHEIIKKNAHILDADIDGMRIDLAKLEMYRAAQDERLSVQRKEWAINQCRHILDADIESIRKELEDLRGAREKLKEYRALENEFESITRQRHSLTNRMEEILPQIESHRHKIRHNLFSSGTCPVCQSKPLKIDSEAMIQNMNGIINNR